MAQNEITNPVQPRQDPNFRDKRPADQIIANPIEGHDYSYHPQAQAIQQGLAMKRLNSGQPAAGMRIGAPSVARQPVGSVGVANAYAQPQDPQQGQEYTAEQASRLSVPKRWGHGEISIGGGPAVHLYTSPEQIAAGRAQQHANEVQAGRDRVAQAHQQAMTHIGSQMDALMNEYYGGRASLDQVANGQAALSQFAAAHLANDAARHQADAERAGHFDPRSNPQYMQALIGQMNADAEHNRADAANKDPMRKLDLIDAINSDPQRRATTLAMQGADPSLINALPSIAPQGQSVNAANAGQLLEQDRNRSLNELLRNQEMPLDEFFTQASGFPGFADRHSETRQLFDQEMARRYAAHPDEWAKQWYVPPKPTGGPIGNFIQTLGARMINAPLRAVGLGAPTGSVGGSLFNGQGDYDAAVRRVGLMNKYGINPYGPIGVNSKESS